MWILVLLTLQFTDAQTIPEIPPPERPRDFPFIPPNVDPPQPDFDTETNERIWREPSGSARLPEDSLSEPSSLPASGWTDQ